MAITDLTGCTWIPNESLDIDSFPGMDSGKSEVYKYINSHVTGSVLINGQSVWEETSFDSEIIGGAKISSGSSIYKMVGVINSQSSSRSASYVYIKEGTESISRWVYGTLGESWGLIKNVQVEIVGGKDVKDSALISWLQVNGQIIDHSAQKKMTSPKGIRLLTEGAFCLDNIEVVPNLQNKVATDTGVVTPDSGYCGLRQVTVSVSKGKPVAVMTESEMQDNLIEENVGRIYQYKGTGSFVYKYNEYYEIISGRETLKYRHLRADQWAKPLLSLDNNILTIPTPDTDLNCLLYDNNLYLGYIDNENIWHSGV